MSFGESVISAGFIQKTIKVDLDVKVNRAYPQRNRHKDLDDTRGHCTEVERQRLLGGAGWPHL
jgi:hypothetical protein